MVHKNQPITAKIQHFLDDQMYTLNGCFFSVDLYFCHVDFIDFARLFGCLSSLWSSDLLRFLPTAPVDTTDLAAAPFLPRGGRWPFCPPFSKRFPHWESPFGRKSKASGATIVMESVYEADVHIFSHHVKRFGNCIRQFKLPHSLRATASQQCQSLKRLAPGTLALWRCLVMTSYKKVLKFWSHHVKSMGFLSDVPWFSMIYINQTQHNSAIQTWSFAAVKTPERSSFSEALNIRSVLLEATGRKLRPKRKQTFWKMHMQWVY